MRTAFNEHGGKAENPEQSSGTKTESETAKFDDGLKKEGKKFEDYIHEDEELEEEGKTYGGLILSQPTQWEYSLNKLLRQKTRILRMVDPLYYSLI